MKIIAYYLPQFHTFKENDLWWGKGFTEWVNVKRATPIFKGHLQPKIPLDNNYYNLLSVETLEWQIKIAKEYGIYGFCWYHYWFDGKLLMEKPMEMMLENKQLKFPFCISWANENWTKQWVDKNKEVLIEQNYLDSKKWVEHFYYLLPFFKDERYIKIDGKPLFIIYKPELIPTLRKMISCWLELAKQNGLEGITFAYQNEKYDHRFAENGILFDYGIEYQPAYTKYYHHVHTIKSIVHKIANEFVCKIGIKQTLFSTIHYIYDEVWDNILKEKPRDEKMFPGAFVNWDNTPRYKRGASVYIGYSAEKFQKYLSEQIKNAKIRYKKDIIFIFAWNEWGEGGYLEPDTNEGYKRLEAVKKALVENDEFPIEE